MTTRQCAATATVLLALTSSMAARDPLGLTLRGAIVEALDRSPDLRTEVDAVQLAAIRREAAKADFSIKLVPAVAATSDPLIGDLQSAGVTMSKRLSTGAQVFTNVSAIQTRGSAATLHETAYTVGVSQPLLAGFSRAATANVATATRAVTSAERGLATARSALVLRVAAEYFTVVKAERMLAAQEQAFDRARAFKSATEARTSVGLATELDVLRAKSLESQTTAGVVSARGAVAEARDRLARTLGRPSADSLDLAAGDTERDPAEAVPEGVTMDDALGAARASRIEIREARDRSADAHRALDVAQIALRPPLALDFSYTRRTTAGGVVIGFNPAPGGFRVGVSATYGADRASATAQTQAAVIAVAAAEREVQDIGDRIDTEVRHAFRNWQTAEAMIPIRREAADIAERELAVAELRFERGLAGSLDVSNAHGRLLEARNAVTAAEFDRVTAALNLQLASGTLDVDRWYR